MSVLILYNKVPLYLQGTSVMSYDANGKEYFFSGLSYFRRYVDHYGIYNDLTKLGQQVYLAINSTIFIEEQKSKVLKLIKSMEVHDDSLRKTS